MRDASTLFCFVQVITLAYICSLAWKTRSKKDNCGQVWVANGVAFRIAPPTGGLSCLRAWNARNLLELSSGCFMKSSRDTTGLRQVGFCIGNYINYSISLQHKQTNGGLVTLCADNVSACHNLICWMSQMKCYHEIRLNKFYYVYSELMSCKTQNFQGFLCETLGQAFCIMLSSMSASAEVMKWFWGEYLGNYKNYIYMATSNFTTT